MLASFLALDPKLLAALGGAASALLAALGYLAKVRHERKRSLRTVLYLLLQLRRQATVAELSLTEIPSGGVAALRRVLDELNLSVPAEFEQLLLLESMPALIATAEQLVHPERQEIRIALSKAIAELSRDSPILAYRLSSALPSAANSTLRDAVEGSSRRCRST